MAAPVYLYQRHRLTIPSYKTPCRCLDSIQKDHKPHTISPLNPHSDADADADTTNAALSFNPIRISDPMSERKKSIMKARLNALHCLALSLRNTHQSRSNVLFSTVHRTYSLENHHWHWHWHWHWHRHRHSRPTYPQQHIDEKDPSIQPSETSSCSESDISESSNLQIPIGHASSTSPQESSNLHVPSMLPLPTYPVVCPCSLPAHPPLSSQDKSKWKLTYP
ncbi:hypothetical protein BDF14DRAFT_1883387 [Spinellus fusiger]|nr:hypothetical protein BDF14DRAFT_1883387 [Spinellus fusiger]